MAQPTTPPPMMTTFTRSMEREHARTRDARFRCAAHLSSGMARRHGATELLRKLRRRSAAPYEQRLGSAAPERQKVFPAFHRFFQPSQELVQIPLAIDKIDFRGVYD